MIDSIEKDTYDLNMTSGQTEQQAKIKQMEYKRDEMTKRIEELKKTTFGTPSGLGQDFGFTTGKTKKVIPDEKKKFERKFIIEVDVVIEKKVREVRKTSIPKKKSINETFQFDEEDDYVAPVVGIMKARKTRVIENKKKSPFDALIKILNKKSGNRKKIAL